MQSRALVSLLVSIGLVCSVASAQETAGPTGPIPRNLDAMIATALKASPEVLLAEAKLRQAQAELNQTRLKVTRDIVAAFNDRKQKQLALESAATAMQQTQQAVGAGAVSRSDVDHARMSVGAAELGVAQSEADIRYLLGIGSQMQMDPFAGHPAASKERAKRPGAAPERVLDALGRPVSGPFVQTNLGDLTAHLADQAKVAILVDLQDLGLSEAKEYAVSMPLREPVSLLSVLQALSDQYRLAFVIRDYGIMATSEGHAARINAYVIPEGLPLDAEDR